MRKLMWFTIGFSAACLAGALLYGFWPVLGCAVALMAAAVLAALRKKYQQCRLPLLIVLGCAVGLAWFSLYDSLFVLVPRAADGQTLKVTMEASDYSYEMDYGSAVEGKVEINSRSYRVKAYLNGKQEVAPGDLVTGTFRFRMTAAGGKEHATSHSSEGIFLLAYPVGKAEITKAEDVSWEYYPALWRRWILNRLGDIFSGNVEAFASALLLGERSGITYEMDTSFRVSGISHIVAVSGLHVSILFGLLYTVLAKRRVLSCAIGIPALFLFAAVAGFTPSITRACIMQSMMLLSMLTDREYDPATALSFAALAMLVVNPMTVLSVSFQLSVGCMVGIFLFSEKIRTWLLRFAPRHGIWAKIYKGIAASASVSFSATVITTPLVAYYFGCVSVVGVVTNVLVIWAISYIFYGLILCLVVSVFSMSIAGTLAWAAALLIRFVLKTADFMAGLPMAAVYTSNPYGVAWLCGVYLLVGIFLMQRKKQPILLMNCIFLTLLLVHTFSRMEPLRDDFRVTVLDVGQGQSILLQSQGKAFLVDCGGDNDEHAADAAAEALLNQGISRLDGIVITHFDRDHAGGVANLLTRVEADRLILPRSEEDDTLAWEMMAHHDGLVEYVEEDCFYSFDRGELTVFAPDSHNSDNENSICVLFRWEDCGILITGDRGTAGERCLIEAYDLSDVDVLVAGHHGSAGSTSAELLAATMPQIAVISVGENNRYGHPSAAVLERLCEIGCVIFRTDIHGTLVFRR